MVTVLCFVIFVAMTPSFGRKRHKSMRRCLGKAPTNDDAALASQDCGVEDLLNQTRFFHQRSQMVEYAC